MERARARLKLECHVVWRRRQLLNCEGPRGAEATRQQLIASGLSEDRFARIEGVADTEPLIADNPADPRNRRISLLLLEGRGAASGGPGANAPPGTDKAVPKP